MAKQPRLRNDGSGKPEITDEDIRKMRTDGWTQARYRDRSIIYVPVRGEENQSSSLRVKKEGKLSE